MTPEEIEFSNAFNRQRPTLAGFAHCKDLEELHIVRDALFLGLARDLCPTQYQAIANHVVMDEAVATKVPTVDGFQQIVQSARESKDEWAALLEAVHAKAVAVGSDIDRIWMTLEQGRLEWLRAVSAAHPLKVMLKDALKKDNAVSSAGDVSDAMMVWIYALCIDIKQLLPAANAWASVVEMADKRNPLKGYQAEKWDPRKDEWRPLDVGAQAAAERGGATLQEAWDA